MVGNDSISGGFASLAGAADAMVGCWWWIRVRHTTTAVAGGQAAGGGADAKMLYQKRNEN